MSLRCPAPCLSHGRRFDARHRGASPFLVCGRQSGSPAPIPAGFGFDRLRALHGRPTMRLWHRARLASTKGRRLPAKASFGGSARPLPAPLLGGRGLACGTTSGRSAHRWVRLSGHIAGSPALLPLSGSFGFSINVALLGPGRVPRRPRPCIQPNTPTHASPRRISASPDRFLRHGAPFMRHLAGRTRSCSARRQRVARPKPSRPRPRDRRRIFGLRSVRTVPTGRATRPSQARRCEGPSRLRLQFS